ncbi:MAG TPA: 6-phosphogluconolactonase [Gemmatimonadales bacterium]|jgi:6-phosphogluconolactonase
MAPIVVASRDEFAAAAAQRITEVIDAAISSRGGCRLALSGGSTPAPVLARLAGRPIEWPRVSIYFADERAVPPDSLESNYAMARRTLLGLVPIPAASVHRMEAERANLDTAARDYDRVLPAELDLLLLGVGPDGHTASLFPGSPALNESARRVVAVDPPLPPIAPRVARLTITPPVIAAARAVVVLVAGADKADVAARVLAPSGGDPGLPAHLARNGTWILDREAAATLQPREV